MVEMLEANHAITHATENSLILLDEVGRGTSTYDGMALAQAIVEYIHDHIHAKTLFSTHYHELTALEDTLDHLNNIHVRAEEHEGEVVFLHQIKDGAADESYGIHVAKVAELPEVLIDRATTILSTLEKADHPTVASEQEESNQLALFNVGPEPSTPKQEPSSSDKIVKELKELDLFDLTPIDAMNELYRLQKGAKK